MVKKVSVLGAGTIGRGVAQLFAQNEFTVTLHDINPKVLNEAKKDIENQLRFMTLFGQENEQSSKNVMEHLHFSMDNDSLKEADFIVENITENRAAKASLYSVIDRLAPPHSILAANTSCIPITELASYIGRPDSVIGIHFMNPVPVISTIEVIKGFHTSQKTLSSTLSLLNKLGKQSVVVNDFPGFVSNRISHLMMNEAIFVIQDQVSTAHEIDEIFKKCYGHKMGPLETADLIGLDTVKHSLDILYESFQDSKYRCSPLLVKMVNAGRLGRKSGAGFYEY